MGTYANFYNSDNGDRIYDAEAFAEWLKPFFKTGVFNNELQVVASSGMNVVVKSGNAYIEGKLKKFDNETVLTLEPASSTVDRIDAIVVRRNDAERDFTIQVIKGSTNAPQPVREGGIYDIVLAHISVPMATTEVTQALITDTRMNANICGWVVANIEEVDFNQITAQFSDYLARFEADNLQEFTDWFNLIKDQLTTDQAGALWTAIEGVNASIDQINTDVADLQSNMATHTHTKAQITDFAHTHDDRYYTESEINTKVNELNTAIANSGKFYGIDTSNILTDQDGNVGSGGRSYTATEDCYVFAYNNAGNVGSIYIDGVYAMALRQGTCSLVLKNGQKITVYHGDSGYQIVKLKAFGIKG